MIGSRPLSRILDLETEGSCICHFNYNYLHESMSVKAGPYHLGIKNSSNNVQVL